MSARERQSRYGGREWAVTGYGLMSWDPDTGETEAHRTDGEPVTVATYLAHWREPLVRVSAEEGVPLEIMLATIATENGAAQLVRGSPRIRPPREEPGYVSDEDTPHRVSIGPCHVLIETAQIAMRDPLIDREWLTDLENNLRASFRYLAQQDRRWEHGYDPILSAAVYNSGGLYDASHPQSQYHNRWHLRSWGSHLDRFANWYGDALAVLRGSRRRSPEPETRDPPLEVQPAPPVPDAAKKAQEPCKRCDALRATLRAERRAWSEERAKLRRMIGAGRG